MEIVLLHDHVSFEAMLADSDGQVLPLLSTEGVAGAFNRLEPNLAARPATEPGHFVVGRLRRLSGRLALRYARFTARPFWDPDSGPPPAAPRSLTIFAPEGAPDPWEAVREVLDAFDAEEPPPFGLISGRDMGWMSLQVARQLQARRPGENVYIENQEPALSRRVVPGLSLWGEATAAALVDAGAAADGLLVIGGHSRSYCGPLFAKDGLAGICTAPGGGADGRCVSGAPCYFDGRPKLEMRSLRAQRVLYNGCATARPGENPYDVAPRANHFDAALIAGVSEYVGNTGPGRSTPSDIAWFLAASAAGRPPAACAQIVDRVRTAEGRDRPLSMAYLGDAANGPWDISNARQETPLVETTERSARIAWAGQADLVFAAIECPALTAACAAGMLGARLVDGEASQVSAIAHRGELLVLIQREGSGPLTVELAEISAPPARTEGEASRALARLSALSRRDAFAQTLGAALGPLERHIADARAATSAQANLVGLGTRRDQAGLTDVILAASMDGAVLERGTELTSNGWLIGGEFDGVALIEARDDALCPLCGSDAQEHVLDLCGGAEAARRQRICRVCGIVADLPAWPLEARITAPPHLGAKGLSLEFELYNAGSEIMHVSASLAVRGVPTEGKGARSEVWLDPQERISLTVECRPVGPLKEFHWVHLTLVSFGALGALIAPLAPRPVLPEQDRLADALRDALHAPDLA